MCYVPMVSMALFQRKSSSSEPKIAFVFPLSCDTRII
jgi:hypothetical protein